MQLTIHPGKVDGTIIAPASKSVMQRACAAAIIKGGNTTIQNYGKSNDDKAALEIITQLGADVTYVSEHTLQITCKHDISDRGCKPRSDMFNFHESGLSSRMFTPIIALFDGSYRLTGIGSLLNRPFDFFETILPQIGVGIKTNNSKLPIDIIGPLKPHNITVDGALSSQFLTGLIMAYAAANADEVSISVNKLSSKPYIDLTLQIMHDFGIPVPKNKDYEVFTFEKSEMKKGNVNYFIEGDWSGAAFLLVAGAVAGNVIIKGLRMDSEQADKKIIEALQQSGCSLSISDDEIEVSQQQLMPFHLDATHCPDLFPPLVALAVHCNGTSIIEGVHRLEHKESNRAASLTDVFTKLGAKIAIQGDQMIVEGGRKLGGAKISSHNDHRIAMAAAIAALQCEGATTILQAECVNKSYPDFWKDITRLCAKL